MSGTIAKGKFELAVNAEAAMPLAMFVIGPAALVIAVVCAAVMMALGLVGSFAAAHVMLWGAIPCTIPLLSKLDRQRLDRARLFTTAAAAGATLSGPVIAASQWASLPEVQTFWFVLSTVSVGMVLATHWPQRHKAPGH